MFLPGFPSPSPEIVAALLTGEKPTPFDALGTDLDLWEGSFGLQPEVRAYIGAERLGTAPSVSGLMPGGRLAGGAEVIESLPQWQRALVVAEDLPAMWKEVWRSLQQPCPKGDSDWARALAKSWGVTNYITMAFSSVGRHDFELVRGCLAFLQPGLIRWAWVVGLLAQQNRPLIPHLVLEALTEEGQNDANTLMEGFVITRLMQGKRSMATYVLGRWLTGLVWGRNGLSGAMPNPASPLMKELHWAWAQRDQITNRRTFLDDSQKKALGDMQWDSSRPNGIASGMALLWDRLDHLTFGSTEGALAMQAIVEKPWVDDCDPWSEAKDGDAVTWKKAAAIWMARQSETKDQSGRLDRVLLSVVTPELATSAGLLVLRWRHHLMSSRVWRNPQGLCLDIQHWLSCVLARMDGDRLELKERSLLPADNHWFRPGQGLTATENMTRLTEEQELDWRVTEVLRPLLFSALASMAIGLKAGSATQLQELDWVRESVWDPNEPTIRIYDVFDALRVMCEAQRCTVPALKGVYLALSGQCGVEVEAIEAWFEAQPFDLTDLEAFRQKVLLKEAEVGEVGGLVETLFARNHFKPSWVTGVLTGLAQPRPHGEI